MDRFFVPIEPVQGDAAAALDLKRLADSLFEFQEREGAEKCATLAQVRFFNDGRYAIDGAVFTGEAMHYLKKHMDAAFAMQQEQDADDAAHTRQKS